MTDLWEDIQPKLTPDYKMLPAPDGGRDNLIFYSALLLMELDRLGGVHLSHTCYGDCEFFLTQCSIAPALYLREPGRIHDDNSQDNLIGAAYVSRYHAGAICKRWTQIGPYFNPADMSDNFGRFLGLHPYILAACGETLSWKMRLVWSLATLFSIVSDKGHPDRLLLHALQVSKMESRGLCKPACFVWRLFYHVPDLLAAWFGKDHPLAVWASAPSLEQQCAL